MNRTIGLPSASRRFVGSRRTHVIERGSPSHGRTLLLLHGFGGSALNWDLVAPLLAEDSRVVALDLHGHGLTPASGAGTTQDVLDQIGEVIRDLSSGSSSEELVLVGSSFGGTLALLFAAQHPTLVDAVAVLAAPTPRRLDRPGDAAMTWKRWLISVPGVSWSVFRRTAAMSPHKVVMRQLEAAGMNPRELDQGIVRDAVDLQARRHNDAAGHDVQQRLLRSFLRLLARGEEFASTTGSIKTPVLWLQGLDDPLVAEERARAFVGRHPAWGYLSRDGVGHVPAVTDPVWIADAISSWIGDAHRSRS